MQLTHICPIDAFRTRAMLPAGERLLNVWTVTGVQPGPTLVITAGVHGCEYVGILALRKLFSLIQPETLRGRLLLLPLVTEEGFYAGAKGIVPEDGKNINRIFPARPDGTAADRIAMAVQTQIYPEADFILDLHGGEANERMLPLVFFPKDASPKANALSRQAASYLQVDVRIPSTAKNGLYSHAARCGIPAVLMEVGGLGLWTDGEVERDLAGIRNLMGFLGMGGEARPNTAQMEARETLYLEAEADGLWFPHIRPGQKVTRDALLGVLEDLEGNPLQTIRAAWDGIIWYHTAALGVRKGDPLIAYGR